MSNTPSDNKSRKHDGLPPQEGWEEANPDTKFPVVGLGASAGGLQALKQFFKGMPAESGMAFVFISEKTVKFHCGYAMQNMRADSLAGLVRMAEKLNIGYLNGGSVKYSRLVT